LRPSPVKEKAREYGIPIYQPLKIRENREFLDTIASYGCDYFVVVAYGKILPKELLDMPKKMCINIHGSILPKYR
jgi:methionyl-tRNA formyltransferase